MKIEVGQGDPPTGSGSRTSDGTPDPPGDEDTQTESLKPDTGTADAVTQRQKAVAEAGGRNFWHRWTSDLLDPPEVWAQRDRWYSDDFTEAVDEAFPPDDAQTSVEAGAAAVDQLISVIEEAPEPWRRHTTAIQADIDRATAKADANESSNRVRAAALRTAKVEVPRRALAYRRLAALGAVGLLLAGISLLIMLIRRDEPSGAAVPALVAGVVVALLMLGVGVFGSVSGHWLATVDAVLVVAAVVFAVVGFAIAVAGWFWAGWGGAVLGLIAVVAMVVFAVRAHARESRPTPGRVRLTRRASNGAAMAHRQLRELVEEIEQARFAEGRRSRHWFGFYLLLALIAPLAAAAAGFAAFAVNPADAGGAAAGAAGGGGVEVERLVAGVAAAVGAVAAGLLGSLNPSQRAAEHRRTYLGCGQLAREIRQSTALDSDSGTGSKEPGLALRSFTARFESLIGAREAGDAGPKP